MAPAMIIDNTTTRHSVSNEESRPRKRPRLTYTQDGAPSETVALSTRPEHACSAVPSVHPCPELHLGLFDIGKPLGKGAYGSVYLAKHKESGWICALKVLDKAKITRNQGERNVRREIDIHSHLRHPGILNFYGWFHDSKRIVIILEYAIGGELFKVLQRARRFPEPLAAKYVAQVAVSLSYMHKKHIMHRDIKPENILLGIYGELKLADFGHSVHATDDRRESVCGTLDYFAPEMILPEHPGYTKAIDQWALGVLAYEFLTGMPPFSGTTKAIAYRRISTLDMDPIPFFVSPEARDFICSLLVLEPSNRLPLEQVLDHPWIKKHSEQQIRVES